MDFDDDIISNIKDLSVLADSLYQMIAEERLFFAEGMQPSSYERVVSAKAQSSGGGSKR